MTGSLPHPPAAGGWDGDGVDPPWPWANIEVDAEVEARCLFRLDTLAELPELVAGTTRRPYGLT